MTKLMKEIHPMDKIREIFLRLGVKKDFSQVRGLKI